MFVVTLSKTSLKKLGAGAACCALVDSRYRKKLAIGRRDLVVAALQRRGFAYPVIKEAIRRVEEEGQRL